MRDDNTAESVSEIEEESLKHVSFKRYLVVWIALSLLTLATYASSRLALGPVAIVLSLLIAVVKATLVALFFMHLWDERGAIPLVLTVSTMLLLVLLAFSVTDVVARAEPGRDERTKPGVALSVPARSR
jgi:cytochrome c oxidase subunit IV